MKNNSLYIILLVMLITLFACNPYKGFSGVSKKGMKKNKLPSQELRKDYEKMNRKAQKAYDKEQKKAHKRLGTKENRNSTKFNSD